MLTFEIFTMERHWINSRNRFQLVQYKFVGI